MTHQVLLSVENITKRFSGTLALENVSLALQAGKVMAVIGENGAGKSTLMKILSGVYPDYEGQMFYKGQAVRFSNPREAQAQGIAIIHQELNLIPYLSVRENIFLGREITTPWGMLNKKEMRLKTQQLLDKLRLTVDPDTQVSQLKVGQQQVVEIAKALLVDAEVIIMDEPTSAISESEVEVLFHIIEELKRENKAIVYISHKLDELFRIADSYIILRDGKMIASGDMKEMCQDEIIHQMVGRSIKIIRNNSVNNHHQVLLSVEDVCLRHPTRLGENLLKHISFQVKRGEIVGLFGLMGAGRTELLETIFGLHAKTSSGNIRIEQQQVHLKMPSDAIQAGMALVPEDRKTNGLLLGMDVKTNISLSTLKNLENLGLLSDSKETDLAEKYIQDLKIKTSSERQLAKNLSGGNQQKIVLAKWLATQPKVLMLDEPTRGIDIHAKNEIYKLILGLAEAGLGILVASSELPEILAISDRILVMAEGSLTAEFLTQEATEDKILKAAIPKTI